jgi:hypothetical protein
MPRLQTFFSTLSIQRLLQSFINNYKNYPLTLLCNLAVTCLLFYLFRVEALNHEIYELNQWRFTQATMILSLGIPLFFSVEIKSNPRKYFYYLGIIAFLGVFAFSADWNSTKVNESFIIRFVSFSIMSHLVVAFLPFLLPINQKINGFWQYNKTLFIRIITSFLYTITLFLGLSLALVGIEQLFDFDLPRNAYLYLWIFLNVFCNTHFFVGGIPKPIEELENDNDYPIGLKYFTQYVLLALVVIYMVILYFYEFKIIAAWNLPRGWVSVLVIACAVFGILAFLLLYPLRTQNEWIKRYTKVFYWVLLPLLGLLAAAIYVRTNEYGITEPRYFVILLTLWLIGITLYFIISKVDNIKFIPISLAVLAFLSAFGPWGAFSVSERSQYNRLVGVLEKGKFLKDGFMQIPKEQKLDSTQSEVISSVFDYFSEKRDLSTIQPLFKEDLGGISKEILKSKMIEYSGGYELKKYVPTTYFENYHCSQIDKKSITVKDFDLYIPLNFNGYQTKNSLKLEMEVAEVGTFEINNKNELLLNSSFTLNFNSIKSNLQKFTNSSDIPKEKMIYDFQVNSYSGRLFIQHLSFESDKLTNIDGYLLLKIK